MKGAGTTLSYIFPGLPYWVGVVLVGAVITLNVALGGMKGITLVQAFQYWAKMFAISVPVFVLMSVHGGYGRQLGANSPAAAISTATSEAPAAVVRQPLPAKAPVDASWFNPFGPLTTKAAKAAHLGPEESKPYALLYTYSLIIALVCGTAGLPHILVRFYTNPDGVSAKRTTMWVMILIGIFYVFPPVFGVMGRNLMPALYEGVGSKGTDKVVLELPKVLNLASPGSGKIPWGSILSGITCAGAFAAFMSTFSGLLVSMTGALAHDVYGRILRPQSSPADRMRMFKWCAVLVGGVATLLGCFVEQLQINFMVGQAFAIAAASYFPLLFMSVWWRGMTMPGAASGMLTGGICALSAVTLTNFSDLKWLPMAEYWELHPLLRILCEQPAIWCVPLAIGLMIVVSKFTSGSVPSDIRMKMLVLHAPEALGLKQEYIRDHEGH
jgi:Na+(H+)/acetate symporter ActP